MLINLRERIVMLAAWQTRPEGEKKRIRMLMVFLAALLPLVTWSWINSSATQVRQDTEQVMSRYERALPLATEVQAAASAHTEKMTGISALAATQQIAREMGIEDRLTSIRPSRALQGREGVQIYLEDLNLPEILQLFDRIEHQAGLQIVTANLNKRPDNPKRADLMLVLAP